MIHTLFSVRIDDMAPLKVHQKITDFLRSGSSHIIVTPNAEFLLLARKNVTFRQNLNNADLAIPDTVSLRFAVAALSDGTLKHRIPGVDLLKIIADLCDRDGKSLLLLGGDHRSAELAAKKLKCKGIDPGRVNYDGDKVEINNDLLARIQKINPDVIAVALGQGKQEAFMFKARKLLPDVKIWIGVGGALEMISGQKTRAPELMRKLGLEWAWRLVIEPKRAGRIFNALIIFPMTVVSSTLSSRSFFKALRRVFPEVYRQLRGL